MDAAPASSPDEPGQQGHQPARNRPAPVRCLRARGPDARGELHRRCRLTSLTTSEAYARALSGWLTLPAPSAMLSPALFAARIA